MNARQIFARALPLVLMVYFVVPLTGAADAEVGNGKQRPTIASVHSLSLDGQSLERGAVTGDEAGALDLAGDTLTRTAEQASSAFEAVVILSGPTLELQSTQPIDLDIDSLNLGFPVTTAIVPYSLADLQTTIAKITSDHSSWYSSGIDITSWGIDDANDRVDVGLADATESAVSQVSEAYGSIVEV